jgi:hypothetical protein
VVLLFLLSFLIGSCQEDEEQFVPLQKPVYDVVPNTYYFPDVPVYTQSPAYAKTPTPCTVCGGDGRIEKTKWSIDLVGDGGNSYVIQEWCYVCDGDGWVGD